MKLIKLASLMLIALVPLSCNDNDEHDYTENLDYWNTLNRVDFKDFNAFVTTYRRIYSMDETQYEEWCDSLSNFESYQHFWVAVNNEYDQLETEADYSEFKDTYKDFVKFSDELIDGLPDYSFEPNVTNISLMRLVNKEGFIAVDGKIYDTKTESIIPGLKSLPDPRDCYKKDGKRKL